MSRIWLFGVDVDTDQMVPGRFAPYMTSEAELANYAFIEARPEFAKEIVTGDIIVAGKNFGCGSSREYAPLALKLAGVGAIIAPSFARIFFRNALNLGLPLFEIELSGIHDGMEVELNRDDYRMTESRATGGEPQHWDLPRPSGFVETAWEEGGLLEYFRRHGALPEMQK